MAGTQSSTVGACQVHVSPHLSLYQSPSPSPPAGSPRTLVLFFPWLYASNRAMERYRNLYISRGLDVLSVNCELKQFLWPKYSKAVAQELLGYLTKNELPMSVDKFFVHALSIGAFVYTVVMLEMETDPNKFSPIKSKICGQVFDSITLGSLDRMAQGVANQINSSAAQFLIKKGVLSYFYLTKKYTVDFYEAGVAFFKSAPVKTPVLVYYSLDDPMCCSQDMDDMITKWKDLNDPKLDVHVKCWTKSIHAGHLLAHPDQYHMALQAFLMQLALEPVESKL